jgi:hypothetical protein
MQITSITIITIITIHRQKKNPAITADMAITADTAGITITTRTW